MSSEWQTTRIISSECYSFRTNKLPVNRPVIHWKLFKGELPFSGSYYNFKAFSSFLNLSASPAFKYSSNLRLFPTI